MKLKIDVNVNGITYKVGELLANDVTMLCAFELDESELKDDNNLPF